MTLVGVEGGMRAFQADRQNEKRHIHEREKKKNTKSATSPHVALAQTAPLGQLYTKFIKDAHVFKPNGSQPSYYFTSTALASVVHSPLPETFFLPDHILPLW